ncbi:MAG: pyridoxal-phosphate dependent enzyme, partial [Actinomycetota bacterium]
NDRSMLAAVAAGAGVDTPATPTFSDGTAGAVEPGAITVDLCASLVDRWLTVDEDRIGRAVADMIDDHHELVEGAAGVALAAAADHARTNPGSTIVVVTCGANASADAVRRMLQAGTAAGAVAEIDEGRQ